MSVLSKSVIAVGFALAVAAPLDADDQPEVAAVIDRAIKSMGGAEKLAKLKAVSWKGKAAFQVAGQDIALTYEGTAQATDCYKFDMEIQAGGRNNKILFIINGDKGWVRADNATNDIPKELSAFARDGMYGIRIVHLLPAVKDKAYTVSHLGELKVGERTAVGLKVTHKDRRDVSVFFDKETGLPLKSETSVTTPENQDVNVEYHYSDYKEFAGMKHFTKITFKVNDMDYTTELSEVKIEDKLEDATFEKPG